MEYEVDHTRRTNIVPVEQTDPRSVDQRCDDEHASPMYVLRGTSENVQQLKKNVTNAIRK